MISASRSRSRAGASTHPFGPDLQCLQLAGQVGQCGGAGPGDEPGRQRARRAGRACRRPGRRSSRRRGPRRRRRRSPRRRRRPARSACSAATTTSRTALFRCGFDLRRERGEGLRRSRPGHRPSPAGRRWRPRWRRRPARRRCRTGWRPGSAAARGSATAAGAPAATARASTSSRRVPARIALAWSAAEVNTCSPTVVPSSTSAGIAGDLMAADRAGHACAVIPSAGNAVRPVRSHGARRLRHGLPGVGPQGALQSRQVLAGADRTTRDSSTTVNVIRRWSGTFSRSKSVGLTTIPVSAVSAAASCGRQRRLSTGGAVGRLHRSWPARPWRSPAPERSCGATSSAAIGSARRRDRLRRPGICRSKAAGSTLASTASGIVTVTPSSRRPGSKT